MDLTELYTIIRTAILADATIPTLLGSATAVYQDRPPVQASFPCITLKMRRENDLALTGPGAFRPVWEIKVWSKDGDTSRAITALLTAVLDIPRTRNDGLTGTAFKINEMRKVDGFDGPTLSQANTAEEISSWVTIWNSLALPLQ